MAVHDTRGSIFGGVAIARALGSQSLLRSVREAFVHGIDVALLVSVGFAFVGLLLTLVFLPARAEPSAGAAEEHKEASSLSRDTELAGGLRERKKAKTRAAIQHEAIRLFSEQGYEATTIEQIAEVVEIAPSTFFRYFRAKEDLVLTDEYDPLIIEAFRAQPCRSRSRPGRSPCPPGCVWRTHKRRVGRHPRTSGACPERA